MSIQPHPNHHLWNNHGTWWIVFTPYGADGKPVLPRQRVRHSLDTPNIDLARRRRDTLLTSVTLSPVWMTKGSHRSIKTPPATS